MTELTYGEAVRRLRIARGLSQDELAALAGISGRQIERLERGQARPSAGRQERVSAALGFDRNRDLVLAASLEPRRSAGEVA